MDAQNNKPIAGISDLDLTQEQQKDCLAKANAGDADAAFQLYEYYEMVRLNYAEALKWLKKAADLGNLTAEYSLGYYYFHDLSLTGPNAAKYREYWIKEAAKSGDPEAIVALKKQSK